MRQRRSGHGRSSGGGHRTAASSHHRPVIASDSMTPRWLRLVPTCVLLAATIALTGCDRISTAPPDPTPADFQGIATELTVRRIAIDDLVSGDAGCDDRVLIPTAIGLTARGIDQVEPVRIYLYVFRNRTSFDRLRSSIDRCARSFVTDPQTFETVEQSPYVLAGQGPWAPGFEAAVREALLVAAGTGD